MPEDNRPKHQQVWIFVARCHLPVFTLRVLAHHHVMASASCPALLIFVGFWWFLQVFFCSRTHSQLSQFIKELQRTAFADTISTVALASRKVGLLPVLLTTNRL